jgi:hypothetical protein
MDSEKNIECGIYVFLSNVGQSFNVNIKDILTDFDIICLYNSLTQRWEF